MYCKHCNKDRSLWHWLGYRNAVPGMDDKTRSAFRLLHERQQRRSPPQGDQP